MAEGYLGNQFMYDAGQQAKKDWREQEANKRRAVSAAYGLAEEAANMPLVLQQAGDQGRADIVGQMGQAYGTAAAGMGGAPTGGAMAGQLRALGAEQGRQLAGWGSDMAQRVQQARQDAMAQQWEAAQAVASLPQTSQVVQQELDQWMTMYDQIMGDWTLSQGEKINRLEALLANMSPQARYQARHLLESAPPKSGVESALDFARGKLGWR